MARLRDSGKPAQIIEAAFDVFGRIGYEATVIKDIADRAGVSPGSIYTYFKDKKDLFKETVRFGWDGFLQKIRVIVESEEPVERKARQLLDVGFGSLTMYLPLLRGMLFESSQMNLMQGKIEEFCGLVARLPVVRRGGATQLGSDREYRRTMIRITVMGVFFSAALAEPTRLDAEIKELKRTITLTLLGG